LCGGAGILPDPTQSIEVGKKIVNLLEGSRSIEKIRGLPLEEQAVRCLSFLGKKPPGSHYERCIDKAQEGLQRIGSMSFGEYLERAGSSIIESEEETDFGGALVRARLEMGRKEILLYVRPLEEMEEALSFFGVPLPRPAREICISHEAFHFLVPDCPEELAEVSAHLFCTLSLSLPFYSGLLDVIHLLYRRCKMAGGDEHK
jgi:hypothetical protein